MAPNEYLDRISDLIIYLALPLDRFLLTPCDDHNKPFNILHGAKEIIMIELIHHGKLTMSQMARLMGSSNQRMTSPVNELEEMQLIERSKEDANKKIVWISPTQKGRELTEEYLNEVYNCLFVKFNNTLSDSLQEELYTDMKNYEKLMRKLSKNC
ncbi:MAG: MarR family transcriptional regulator [Clostridia bacterium]